VTWAIRPAGASADVLVGKASNGSPEPGSSPGSCAALMWQKELDMSGGPSRQRLRVVRQREREKARDERI